MTAPRRMQGSEYIQWARTTPRVRFNLATSGLANVQLKELDVRLDDLEITGNDAYGYRPLVEALAARVGVPSECVVTAAGTSFANHLAMATVVRRGDEVLIEHPTYEPLLSVAHYLEAEVSRFPRVFEESFQISLQRLKENISSRTRLIVITNLNNPSGALTGPATMTELGELAAKYNARVLVDEVYLEAFFAERPPTAFRYGSQFIVTSSLTKAFGLSGLRCGWIIADPELVQKMWYLNDLFAATSVHAGERLSAIALKQIDKLSLWAETRLQTNRELVNQFLNSRDDLEIVRPKGGTIFFPRLRQGSVDRLYGLLRDKYETAVVPGRFFEMPQHFRIGVGGDTANLSQGLQRLGQALDELRVR